MNANPIIGSVFEAEYKGHKLRVSKRIDLNGSPWQVEVQFKELPEGNVLEPLDPTVPELHTTVAEAKQSACEFVTMIADEDRLGKTCEEAGIVWTETA